MAPWAARSPWLTAVDLRKPPSEKPLLVPLEDPDEVTSRVPLSSLSPLFLSRGPTPFWDAFPGNSPVHKAHSLDWFTLAFRKHLLCA